MTFDLAVPRLEVSIPLDPSRLARFRERVRDYLCTYCSSRRETDEIILSLEEAATNAILHSGSRDDLRIGFGFVGDELRVTVSDRGVGFDVSSFDPRRVPDLLSLGGRGLFLISRMTDHLELEVNGGLSVRFRKRMQMRPQPLDPRSMHEAAAGLALPHPGPGRERLTAMIEELPDGFVALDWEYRIAYVNREAEKLLRIARDRLLGRSAWDVLPEASGGRLAALLHEAMEQGRPHRLEQWIASLSCWWDMWLYPMSSGLSVYVNDITQRKLREEEELRDVRHLRAAFERAPVGVALLDLDGRFLRVNDRYCEITGYPRAELLGRTFAQITHPDDVFADIARVEALRAGEIVAHTMDKRYVRKDGAIIWASLTVSLARDEENSPEYLVAVVQDVGERKRAEESFRLREQALQQSLERTAMLADIGHAAGAAWSLPDVCDTTLRACAVHLGLLAGSVHVVDRSAGLLSEVTSLGCRPQGEPGRRSIPLDEESSVGRLVLQGLPFVSSDTERRPGIPAGARGGRECDWDCWVAVGIPGRDEGFVGVLTLVFPQPRPFAAVDFALFVGIADQLGAALERVELHGAMREVEAGEDAAARSGPDTGWRRAQREALEAMVDVCETALASVGRDLTLQAANVAFARQAGLAREALVGRQLGEVAPGIAVACARVMETGRPEVFRGTIAGPEPSDSTEGLLQEVRLTPCGGTDGTVAGLVISVARAVPGSPSGS